MDRLEIAACGADGEDIFSEMSSKQYSEKKCLDFRGSLHNDILYFVKNMSLGFNSIKPFGEKWHKI